MRSWLGVHYAPAERFRRATLLPFDPTALRLEGTPLQAGDTSWLETYSGSSEECLNFDV